MGISKDRHNKTWSMQEVGERRKIPLHVPTLQEKKKEITVEDIETQARANGYAAGYAQGIETAEIEKQRLFDQLHMMLMLLEHPVQLINQQIEQALLEMTLAISEHLVCQSIQQTPEQILSIIKAILPLIPMTAQKRILVLNPQDICVLEGLVNQFAEREKEIFLTCQLLADQTLQHGECRLDTEVVQVDATWHARIREIIEEWTYQTQPVVGNNSEEKNDDSTKEN